MSSELSFAKIKTASYLYLFIIIIISIRNLQRQLELAQKRNNQLNDVVEVDKAAATSPPR